MCVSILMLCGFAAVTTELVRLTTENAHLEQERRIVGETSEKLSEKAANLVSVSSATKIIQCTSNNTNLPL